MPFEVFQDYLADLRGVWTPEAYSLFDNNCNNFSDEVAHFLVGTGIPVRPPLAYRFPCAITREAGLTVEIQSFNALACSSSIVAFSTAHAHNRHKKRGTGEGGNGEVACELGEQRDVPRSVRPLLPLHQAVLRC